MRNGGGHYGPFVYIEDYYTNAPRTFGDLSQTEQTQMYLMTAVGLNTPLQELAQKLGSNSFSEGVQGLELKTYEKQLKH